MGLADLTRRWFGRGESARSLSDSVVVNPPISSAAVAPSMPAAPFAPAADANEFALALYSQLRMQPGNLFFAPFGIRGSLAVAYAGAAGGTAAQMAAVLKMDASGDVLHSDIAALQDAAGARRAINHWVASQTNGRFPALIPQGGLPVDTTLAVVNATSFKGTWLTPFESERTMEEPFHLLSGTSVRAPLMRQRSFMQYADCDTYQAVELSYDAVELSLLVLLPDRLVGLPALESAFSTRLLVDTINRMEEQQVDLLMPRFRMNWSGELRDSLSALGMRLAFDRAEADFSGVNGRRPPDREALCITGLAHEAFVEVNEQGTEAAAVSALVLAGAPRQPARTPVFRADRPFLVAIRDNRSGALVFLGRVLDPTASMKEAA